MIFYWNFSTHIQNLAKYSVLPAVLRLIIGDPISDRIADYCNDLEHRFC